MFPEALQLPHTPADALLEQLLKRIWALGDGTGASGEKQLFPMLQQTYGGICIFGKR